MTDTDHAARARRVLRGIPQDELASNEEALAWGQLNATLALEATQRALVEQQRIANLIALADHAHSRFGAYAGDAGGLGTLFSYGETPASNIRVRDDIKKALGL